MPIDASTLTPQQQITAIYVAYYDRAPDPAGLQFWVDQLNGGRSLELIATDFSGAAETIEKYPFFDAPDVASGEVFINAIYNNLFGRAPDEAGRDFWTNQLESGSTPVGEIILAIFEGAQDTAEGDDLSTVQNKIAAGLDWATDAAEAGVGTSTNLIAEEVDGELVVNNQAAFDSATSILDGVTGDPATVADAAATTDAFFGNLDAETFTLTAGLDALVGTDSNDTFNAQFDANGDVTLTDFDNLDGGEGTDTLNARLNGDNPGGFFTPPSPAVEDLELSNIEIVNLRLEDGSTVDLDESTGIEQIWNDRSEDGADLTVQSINDDAVLGFREVNSDITATFNEGAVADGAVDVALMGSGEAPSTAGFTDNNSEGAVNLNVTVDDAVTAVNLNATGDMSRIDLVNVAGSSEDVTDLNISGDADLFVNVAGMAGPAGEIQNITSTSTGDMVIVAGGDTQGDTAGDIRTVTLGAGNNRYVTNAAGLDGNDLIDLGAGTNEFELHFGGAENADDLDAVDGDGASNNDVVAAVNAAAGVSTLIIDTWTGSDDVNMDASFFTGVNDFVFNDTHDGAANVQGTLDGSISVTGVENDDTFTVAIDLAGAASFEAETGATDLNLTAQGDIGSIVTTDIETVNLNLDTTTDFTTALDIEEGTTVLVTGEDTASVSIDLDTLADDTTVDLSGLMTDGQIDVTYTDDAPTIADVSDANVLRGSGGENTLIGTDQDDVIEGDVIEPGVAQQTTVDLTNGNVDEGDIYRVTINGETVEHTATFGQNENDVENALINLINGNATLSGQGITATDNGVGNGFTLTGNADGSAFMVDAEAENATLTREVQTIDFGTTDFDGRTPGGDQLTIDVNGTTVTATLPGPVTGTNVTPQAAASAMAAAIAATPALAGDGITANSSGSVLTIFGAPDGSDLGITLNNGDGVVEAAPRADREAVYTTGTDAGDVISFSVQGVDFQFVSNGDDDDNAQTIVNLINSSTALGGNITVSLDTEGDFFIPNASDIAIITSTDGTDVDLAASVAGGGSATIIEGEGAQITTDLSFGPVAQEGDTATDNALGAPVTTVEGNPEGANDDNENTDFDIVTTVDGVAGVGASADVMTGGAGNDLFVVESGAVSAAGADIITDFMPGDDIIDFENVGSAGTADNYSEGPAAGFGNFAGALTQAQSDFQADADLQYVAQAVGNDVYLFSADDFAADGIGDVVQLTGVSLSDLNDNGNFIIA